MGSWCDSRGDFRKTWYLSRVEVLERDETCCDNYLPILCDMVDARGPSLLHISIQGQEAIVPMLLSKQLIAAC